MAVEFRVLGPVEAEVDGRPLDLGHVRQRAVLAVLLVDANGLVSLDQLADRVWGERAPQRISATIYSYLSRLRRSLAGVEGVELARRTGGYVLVVDPMAVDLHRFRRLVADARTVAGERAVVLLDEALRLWRGEPFAGIDTAWLAREREAAAGERLAAELDRNDLGLALGRHAQLLTELATRADRHPFDERLAGQLMLALYRSGRQADALAHFERIRRSLADHLGADPSPALRTLHRQILSADPSLDVPVAADASPSRPAGTELTTGPDASRTVADELAGAQRPAGQAAWWSVPRQLPAPPSAFTGRTDQLAELGRTLAPDPDRAATVVISAIGGIGGVGKTWLALHWAHQNIDKFPDGQLYVNLRGFDPGGEPLLPEIAVRGFLEALGIPAETVPAHLDAQSALYRSLTVGRRMLVMLDNARDSAQVVPLLPGSPTCTVLVTSRNSLTGLVTAHGARPLVLDVLPDEEARELLVRHLGADRVAADPAATAALVEHCAGLPLALGIVAARATVNPELSLSALAEELRGAATRLDALDAGELSVNLRAVLSSSHAALGPDAAEVFSLLGLAPGPDVGLPAVASLAALPLVRARALLGELVHAHLLQEPTPRRYRMHDLVRLFAAELAQRRPDLAREADHRILDFFLHTANAADGPMSPGRAPIPLEPPRPGVVPEPMNTDADALAWFVAERQTLVRAVEHAAAAGFDRHAWRLAAACHRYLSLHEHWHDLLITHTIAIAAAERLADPVARTHAHRGLGVAYIGVRRYPEAQVHLTRALAAAEEVGDVLCLAQAHRSLGRLFARQDRFAEALRHDEQALALWRAAGNEYGQAMALNAVGWHLAHLGEQAPALAHCQEALALYQRQGDRNGHAMTLDSIAYVHLRLGEYRESIEYYQRAIDLFAEAGHTVHVGRTLAYLGEVHMAAGDPRSARAVWEEALRIYDGLGHPAGDALRDRLRDLAVA